VEKASTQITSLMISLIEIGHVLLPTILCIIKSSPLENYLGKEDASAKMLLTVREQKER